MPQHDCPLNYVSSSKGMEATVALEMVIEMYYEHQGRIFVTKIISDDDSTMRAKVSHKASNVHGKLSPHISDPKYKVDPGHRIKSTSKQVLQWSCRQYIKHLDQQ